MPKCDGCDGEFERLTPIRYLNFDGVPQKRSFCPDCLEDAKKVINDTGKDWW